MPKPISEAERQESLNGAKRLRANAVLEDLKSEQARLQGRDTLGARHALRASQLRDDALAIETNLARYDGIEEPPDDIAKPAPTLLDGSQLIADELARQKERDQAGTEPRMLSGFAIRTPSQRTAASLKEVNFIRPGQRNTGFRYST